MNRSRSTITLLVVAMLLAFSLASVPGRAQAQSDPNTLEMQHPFAAGGHLTVYVNVAAVRVERSKEAQTLRMTVTSQDGYLQSELREVVKPFAFGNGTANVEVEASDHHQQHTSNQHGLTVTLYVPEQTGLDVTVKVGQLTVGHIRGDKKLDVGVGKLQLNAVDASDYARMEADCGIGNVSDSVFHAQHSGWLGMSETATGDGKYMLKAHVGVGEVDFPREEAQI